MSKAALDKIFRVLEDFTAPNNRNLPRVVSSDATNTVGSTVLVPGAPGKFIVVYWCNVAYINGNDDNTVELRDNGNASLAFKMLAKAGDSQFVNLWPKPMRLQSGSDLRFNALFPLTSARISVGYDLFDDQE